MIFDKLNYMLGIVLDEKDPLRAFLDVVPFSWSGVEGVKTKPH